MAWAGAIGLEVLFTLVYFASRRFSRLLSVLTHLHTGLVISPLMIAGLPETISLQLLSRSERAVITLITNSLQTIAIPLNGINMNLQWATMIWDYLGLAYDLKQLRSNEIEMGRIQHMQKKLERKSAAISWGIPSAQTPVIDWDILVIGVKRARLS